jgi:hypothetical protein
VRTSTTAAAGLAELLLISDFSVENDQLQHVRKLFGEDTCDEDIAFSPDRRVCRWPLRVAYSAGVVNSLSFHVYLCSTFLSQRREVVEQIRSLGCNLELAFHVPGLVESFILSASAMKQLSDLQIQLALIPTGVAKPAPLGGEAETRPA